MFLLGLTQDFSLDVLNIVAATWFLSVGYLFWKHASRRARVRVSGEAVAVETEALLDSEREEALARG